MIANKFQEQRSNWLRSMAVYADRRVLAILLLGFSSGLPLALTFGTLSIWLVEEGVSKTTIDILTPMRQGADDDELRRLFMLAVDTKPEGNYLKDPSKNAIDTMSSIGG